MNKPTGRKYSFVIISALVFAFAVLILIKFSYNLTPDSELTDDFFITINPDNTLCEHEKPVQMHHIDSIPLRKILLGKFSVAQKDSLLIKIDPKFANRDGLLMNREAYAAFIKMHQEAKSHGIDLIIVSAFRDFNHQKRIWENKWNGQQRLSGGIKATDITDLSARALEILKYSAMPGTSRHHWGTDIDINSLNNSYFESGKGNNEYQWLKENASKYGFCQPYTPRSERENKGYEEEKWHWSYMPLAQDYISHYLGMITNEDLNGFEGFETAVSIDVINNYVKAINKECIL